MTRHDLLACCALLLVAVVSFPGVTAAVPVTFHDFDQRGDDNVTSLTFTIGEGGAVFAVNDLCLVAVTINSDTTITGPGDWTVLRTLTNGTTLSTQYAYRYNCGADTYTWDFGTLVSANGAAMTFSNVSPAVPVDAENGQTTPSDTSHVAPSVTTTTFPNDMLVGLWAVSAPTTLTPPVSMTLKWRQVSSNLRPSDIGAIETLGHTGSSGTRIATCDVAGVGTAELIALRPDGPTPTPMSTPSNTMTPTSTPIGFCGAFAGTCTPTETPTNTPTPTHAGFCGSFAGTCTPTQTPTQPTPTNTPPPPTSTNTPSGLVIHPIFDTSITTDPDAATIMNTINAAIAVYEARFSNPITVSIEFREMIFGLGMSLTHFDDISYASYFQHLAAHATTAADTTALAHLPNGPINPVNGNVNMSVTTANLRVLGFNANPPAGQPDSRIGLNTSLCNLSRSSLDPRKYDLMAVVSHEIDEALGLGSGLNGLPNGAPAPTGPVWGPDLFRYDQTGTRSFNTTLTTHAFFSIDGTTPLARFNQDGRGDYQDWFSIGPHIPQVQDAFGSPGVTADLGVELTTLDVIGYSLVDARPTASPTNTPTPTNTPEIPGCCGDSDEDGTISTADATKAILALVNRDPGSDPAAQCATSGMVTTADATKVILNLVGRVCKP